MNIPMDIQAKRLSMCTYFWPCFNATKIWLQNFRNFVSCLDRNLAYLDWLGQYNKICLDKIKGKVCWLCLFMSACANFSQCLIKTKLDYLDLYKLNFFEGCHLDHSIHWGKRVYFYSSISAMRGLPTFELFLLFCSLLTPPSAWESWT